MSRINTNVNSLLAQRVLTQNNTNLNNSLERLSTGLRINRGADDPAGLIASENLRSEKAAISAAIGNAERADQVVNIAEGGLQEINALLLEVQGLVGSSANDAGLSREEREANQLQVDSILQTIDRIASATSFQGTKLLNGTFDFTVSAQASQVLDLQVNAAKLAFEEQRDVQILVTNSAQRAGLFLSLGGTAFDLSSDTAQFRFEVAGSLGSREFTFASGATNSSVAANINTFKAVTGVSAVASGNGIYFKSTEFGSDEFVSLDIADDGGQAGGVAQFNSNNEFQIIAAGFVTLASAESSNAVRDAGEDVGAIINGVQATSDGRVARINTDFLDVEIELSIDGTQNIGAIDAFTITGGGAKFNLGPNVDILNQVSVGIQNVAARNLGTVSNGFLDELGSSRAANLVDGDLGLAQKITNDSITQISSLRGRLGAFQKNIIGATIRSLGVALENTSAAESSIRDTDFAAETAELTRSQILVQASTQSLSIANSQPQNVLSLLG
ncbi:flagellin [Mucisphaera sp.]|uniref:flagellin N-terminal helical domain-containing protein n=1 Tax=Mucisphaera sp. TaxID=2913024 RepID=UPI003D0FC852